jgi:hypothetical protein
MKKALLIIIFILVHIPILINIYYISRDMILGDESAVHVFPQPQLGMMRIYERPSIIGHEAINRLAVDFAQVYFPSQEFSSLSKNYQTGYLDPYLRPSRYAPFVHFLCRVTLCNLDYGYASIFHMLIQLLLFYAFFIFAFKALNVDMNLWPGLLLANICLFLTPVGLAWFERGQFSLYVAISYLLVILGLFKRNFFLVILSALFAYIKWTSFPYIFVVISLFLLNSKNRIELKQNTLLVSAFLIPILFLLLLFPAKSYYFLAGLYYQERYATPEGVSLALILPTEMVKALPLLMVILGYFHIKASQNVFNQTLPYLLGSAIALLTYPTVAFEYSVSSLLCFIPLTLYWANLPNVQMNKARREFVKYSFFLFLLLASNSIYVNWLFPENFVDEYLFFSAIFILLPLFGNWKIPVQTRTTF